MNSPCTLDFLPGEVRISRGPGDGGEHLGSVVPDVPEAAARIAELRAEALAGSNRPADAVLRLSAEDITLATLDPDRSQTEAIHAARVRRALAEMGPRPAADLTHDWVLDAESRAWIAAVPRDAVRAAEAFAATHGFRVVGVTASLPPGSFPRAPDFALAGPDGAPRLTAPPRRMARKGSGPAALRASRAGATPIRPAREETEWAHAPGGTAPPGPARSGRPLVAGGLALLVAAFAVWTIGFGPADDEAPEVETVAAAPAAAPDPERPETATPDAAAADPVLLPIALLDAPVPVDEAAADEVEPDVRITRGAPRVRPPSRPAGVAAAPTAIPAPRPRPERSSARDDVPEIRAIAAEASAAIADAPAPTPDATESPEAASREIDVEGAAASPGVPQARPSPPEPPAVPAGPVEAALRAAVSESEAVAAAPEASAPDTALALARSLRPDARPGDLQPQDAPAIAPQADAPATPRVAAAPAPEDATDSNRLRLDRPSLIGVYGTQANRRALVRLPNGRFVKVQVGDRVDGGRVSDIDLDQLRYTKGGRAVSLSMPRG